MDGWMDGWWRQKYSGGRCDLEWGFSRPTLQMYTHIHGYLVVSFPQFKGTGFVYVCIPK